LCPDHKDYPHSELLGDIPFVDADTLSLIAKYDGISKAIFAVTTRVRPLRRLIAWVYHHIYGKSVFEPQSLMELTFKTPLANLKTMIRECIIKPNIWQIIRDLQDQGLHVHIIVGKDDYYYPMSMLLGEAFSQTVRIHRVRGEHHLLFNDPSLASAKILAILTDTRVQHCPYI
jgi:hypothetical protein